MKAILWDVDTQEDFVDAEGALYVPNGPEVREAMERAVQWAQDNDIVHVASMDDHEYSDDEIVHDGANFKTTFPPHCMRGTAGWEKVIETTQINPVAFTGTATMEDFDTVMGPEGKREIVLLKKNFNVFTVPAADWILGFYDPEVVYIFGVASDICVNAAIHGILDRSEGQHKVIVIEDACAGLDPQLTADCRKGWEERGVEFITTADLRATVPS